MFFIGSGADEATDDHEGYVAGRRADGTRTDIWTDVSRGLPGDFVGYLPACECGWNGTDRPADPDGYRSCQRAWLADHFVAAVAPGLRAGPRPSRIPDPLTDADFDWGIGQARSSAGRARPGAPALPRSPGSG
ncbi:MAG TPA: hypothetical protein VGH99_02255 [Pseudonocardia sp.]